LWGKRFKHDHLITIDEFTAALMGEVATMVRYPLMNLCQDRLLFGILPLA
jgi:hypothetical protein